MTWELAFLVSIPFSVVGFIWITSNVRSRIALRKEKEHAVKEAALWLHSKQPRHS